MLNYNNAITFWSGNKPLYVKGWTASKTTNIKLNVLAIPVACLPFPFPSLDPSIIPGKYTYCNLFPRYRMILGIYKGGEFSFLDFWKCVSHAFSNVFFPTEGKPIWPNQVSPDFMSS